MNRSLPHIVGHMIVIGASAVVLAACAAEAPLAPTFGPVKVQPAALPHTDTDGAIATLQRATARYHNLNTAIADGFVLLHPCEDRPGEGPIGTVYVHMDRLLDGQIDAALPDALIYEPHRDGLKLVGVELAILKGMWSGQTLPQFLGATFQTEDEFGVYALHAWVWRDNPEGLFAERNPRVSCAEA